MVRPTYSSLWHHAIPFLKGLKALMPSMARVNIKNNETRKTASGKPDIRSWVVTPPGSYFLQICGRVSVSIAALQGCLTEKRKDKPALAGVVEGRFAQRSSWLWLLLISWHWLVFHESLSCLIYEEKRNAPFLLAIRWRLLLLGMRPVRVRRVKTETSCTCFWQCFH